MTNLKNAVKASFSYVMGGLFALVALEPIVSGVALSLLVSAFILGLPLFTLLVVLLVNQRQSATVSGVAWAAGLISTGVLTSIVVLSSLFGNQEMSFLLVQSEALLHTLIILVTSLVVASLTLCLMQIDCNSDDPDSTSVGRNKT